jgi:hypothetical protein
MIQNPALRNPDQGSPRKSIDKSGNYQFAVNDVTDQETKSFNDPNKMVDQYMFKFECISDSEYFQCIVPYWTTASFKKWDTFIDKNTGDTIQGGESKLKTFLSGISGKSKYKEICPNSIEDVLDMTFTADLKVEKNGELDNGDPKYKYTLSNFKPLGKLDTTQYNKLADKWSGIASDKAKEDDLPF